MEAVDMQMVKRVWQRVRKGLPEPEKPKRQPKRQSFRPGYSLEQTLLVAICLKCIKKGL